MSEREREREIYENKNIFLYTHTERENVRGSELMGYVHVYSCVTTAFACTSPLLVASLLFALCVWSRLVLTGTEERRDKFKDKFKWAR